MINSSTNKPFWSLTNFSLCLQPSDEFVENLEESTIIEVFLNNFSKDKKSMFKLNWFSLIPKLTLRYDPYVVLATRLYNYIELPVILIE